MTGRPLLALLLAIAGCAAPQPTPSAVEPTPTPSPSPSPTPTATPTPEPTLAVGRLATVLAETPQVADPSRPLQKPGPSPLPAVDAGARVYLLDGPRAEAGRTYWKVAAGYPDCCTDFGWIPEAGTDGTQLLEPVETIDGCPQTPHTLSGAELKAMPMYARLACFGTSQLVIKDLLRCVTQYADGYARLSGPTWVYSSGIACVVGEDADAFEGFSVYRIPESASAAASDHAVQFTLSGHFSDASSSQCRWVPDVFGPRELPNPSVESAVLACRLEFVVTSATKEE